MVDHVFELLVVNHQWLDLYKDARFENLSIVGLDDGSILQTTDSWDLAGKYSPFKFDANRYSREAL